MAKEICISSTPHETRLAILEDDLLTEIYYERENEYTLAGSIYKGRVTRVLPGMQSAFVDIGLERDAFLYVSDFLELTGDEDSEEFGEIPAPATTINLSRQSQSEAEPATTATTGVADEQAEFVASVESFASEDTDVDTDSRENAAPVSNEAESADGARRWRGRRRRGGRRGGRDDRSPRTEARTETAPAAEEPPTASEPVIQSRPE